MEAQKPTSLKKEAARVLPGLIISAVLLVGLFSTVDFRELAGEFRNADYRYVVPAIFLFVLSLFARTFAWRTLLKNQVSFGKVFLTINEGYLLNNFLPFRLGEVGRAFLISRGESKVRFWQALSTIMVERILDVLLIGGLVLVTLPFVVGMEGAESKALLAVLIMAVGLLFLFYAARNRDFFLRVLGWFQARISFLKFIKASQVHSFFDGLSVMTDFRRFSAVLFWLVLNWSITAFLYYLTLLAFVPSARFVWAAFGLGMVGLGVAIPSAPGGLGVVQAALVFVLRLFDVSYVQALAYAITVHAVYYFITSLLGIYGLMVEGESLVGLYRALRSRAPVSPENGETPAASDL